MRKFLLYFLSITCIGIFVLSSHTSNAWTWEDFTSFLNSTKTLPSNSNTKSAGTYLVNNQSYVEGKIAQLGVDIDNYNCFFVTSNRTGIMPLELFAFNLDDTYTCSINSNAITFNKNVTGVRLQIMYSNYVSNKSDQTFNSYSYIWGLISIDPQNGNYGNLILQNAFNYINILPRDNLTTINLPWYIADGRIGNLYVNDDLHFYLNLGSDRFDLYEHEVLSSPYILRQLLVNNYIGLVNGGTYNITLESDSNVYLTSSDFILEWEYIEPEPENPPGGTITNPSGDITGKIDLTNIENSLNNIDNGIQEMPNKFYNDGSGEPGIFQKVYNDLFTLDSGDVTEIYDNLKDHFTSGDTPLITFTAFLDVLGQEPGDFIIQWDPIPINLTIADGQTLVSGDFISGDSINFSALARENDVLATCKFWINTILSFSVITILLFESYRIILKAMGVATDLYNEADQDEQTTLTESESSGTITNPTTGEVRPQNIRKTRTITTRRRF